MALYQINISYDGTVFHGYQRQVNQRTVQGEIESALRKIGWNDYSILSSGRTDAGVHADEQVAAFVMDWKHSIDALRKAINSHMPDDVAIVGLRQRPDLDFHPRYHAESRIYRYQIYTSESRLPLVERYAWKVWPQPDFNLLQSAASLFLGCHDFRNFGKPYETGGRTVRNVIRADWEIAQTSPRHLLFRIEANSFLYHMVRRIVFVLVQSGQGKVREADITNTLEDNGNLPTGIAPANGLFLEKINY